ncbi:hypothetical protein OH76DRAFT_985586 [Lentinus brumalis]|uniref:Uncharacterized protein n=1 Tax=Lentinus brumalis TaxID=2498619 RepID=A0A371DQ39_9APHY|nr:hypothetical protein OH76DRAFT_985586 [Polyporus brumalis]
MEAPAWGFFFCIVTPASQGAHRRSSTRRRKACNGRALTVERDVDHLRCTYRARVGVVARSLSHRQPMRSAVLGAVSAICFTCAEDVGQARDPARLFTVFQVFHEILCPGFAGGGLIIAPRASRRVAQGPPMLLHARPFNTILHPEESAAGRSRNWTREAISQTLQAGGASVLRPWIPRYDM